MDVLIVLALAFLGSASVPSDETVSAYATAVSYELTEIDGAAFGARSTIGFVEGSAYGMGPCNAYNATVTVPYPWFELSEILVLGDAPCGPEEAAFFDALRGMTLAEAGGELLILSDDAGRQMVFTAD